VTSDQLSRGLFTPHLSGAWIVLLGVLLCVVMSHLSYRFLRKLPDFPDRPAMLRGARWGGLVIASWAVICAVFGALCAEFTALRLSGPYLFEAVCLAGFLWLVLRGGSDFDGVVAIITQLRTRPFDLDQWLADHARRKAEGRRWRLVLCLCLAFAMATYLGMAWLTYHENDRPLAADAQDTQFGSRVHDPTDPAQVRSASVLDQSERPRKVVLTCSGASSPRSS
jgi:hypothetical protein